MLEKLSRWFTLKRPTTPEKRTVPSPAVQPGSTVDEQCVLEIHRMFFGLFFSNDGLETKGLLPAERSIISKAEKILADPQYLVKSLPRFPSIIPRLMHLMRDDATGARQISDLINRDPGLAVNVLKRANSAYYNVGSKIEAVERAVVLLGLDSIKSLVAETIMQPLINIRPLHHGQFVTRIWRHSLETAIACRNLARSHQFDEFTAHLAGLVHEIGTIVAFQTLLECFDRHRSGDPPRAQALCWALHHLKAPLTLEIARQWSLPDTIQQAFEVEPGSNSREKTGSLGTVLAQANLCSELYQLLESEIISDKEVAQVVELQGLEMRLVDGLFQKFQRLEL